MRTWIRCSWIVLSLVLFLGLHSTATAEEHDRATPLSVIGVRLLNEPLRQAERWCEEHRGVLKITRRNTRKRDKSGWGSGAGYRSYFCKSRGDRRLLVREKNGRIVFYEFKHETLSRDEVLAAYESLSKEAGDQKRDDDYAKEKGDVDRQTVWIESAESARGVETMASLQYQTRYEIGRLVLTRAITNE